MNHFMLKEPYHNSVLGSHIRLPFEQKLINFFINADLTMAESSLSILSRDIFWYNCRSGTFCDILQSFVRRNQRKLYPLMNSLI